MLDRVLTLDRELTHLELETAARYLNENFHGWPIERIRTEVARRMEAEREAYHQMLASVEELCRKGALAAGETVPALFVDGMANLIAAEVDRERLRQMLLALEAKQRLVELLTAYVDGRQQEVRVVVGLGSRFPGDAGPGADWRAGAAGGRQPGNCGGDCAHADPVPGDDPGGAVRGAALGAHPRGPGGVRTVRRAGHPPHGANIVNEAQQDEGHKDGTTAPRNLSLKKTMGKYWGDCVEVCQNRRQS